MVTIKQPYIPFLAISGRYSNFYKGAKTAAASGFDRSLVVGKKWIEKERTNRLTIKMESGVAMDLPYDLSKTDVAIVIHQVEGIKMGLRK